MKFVVAVLLVASLAAFCQGEKPSKEERRKQLELIAKKCQGTENATELDVHELYNFEVPSTDTGKCLRACLFETVGLLQGLKIDLEGMLAWSEQTSTDLAPQKVLKEAIEECIPLAADPNRCTLIGNFIQCCHNKYRALGFDPTKVFE